MYGAVRMVILKVFKGVYSRLDEHTDGGYKLKTRHRNMIKSA